MLRLGAMDHLIALLRTVFLAWQHCVQPSRKIEELQSAGKGKGEGKRPSQVFAPKITQHIPLLWFCEVCGTQGGPFSVPNWCGKCGRACCRFCFTDHDWLHTCDSDEEDQAKHSNDVSTIVDSKSMAQNQCADVAITTLTRWMKMEIWCSSATLVQECARQTWRT